jgi:hypothetical protein
MRHRDSTRAIAPTQPRHPRADKSEAKPPAKRGEDRRAPDALTPGPPPMPDLTLQPQVAQPDRDAHEHRVHHEH